MRPRFLTVLSRVASLVLAIVLTGVIAGGWTSVFSVASESMEPALKPGDLVFVDRFAWYLQEHGWRKVALQHGDVIVFRSARNSDTVIVKRVIALPGESIFISRGTVFIDGIALAEPYVQHFLSFDPDYDLWPIDRGRGGPAAVIVPGKHYFVLGDNRDGSIDSRHWGSLPRGNILGVVKYVIRRRR